MLFLIDGYNLLHAIGLVAKRKGPYGLKWARQRLLRFLHDAFQEKAASVNVIFDASTSPKGSVAEQEHGGVHVTFAVHHHEADDLIELLIRKATTPKELTVVSDDHRIQDAGRRRHCVVLGCAGFLDWLMEHQRQQPERADAAAKPEGLSEKER